MASLRSRSHFNMKSFACLFALQLLRSVHALYDPFNDFCKLLDHSSAIKNGVLYIDGGREVFTTFNSSGGEVGPRVIGLNEYLITLDMTKAWDAKSSPPVKAVQKSQGVPYLVRGSLFDYPGQNKLLMFGGSDANDNMSFVGYQKPQDESKSTYTYDIGGNSWTSTDLTTQGLVRPNSGAAAVVPSKGLAFYFNGQQDNGSSIQSSVINDTTRFLNGMIVLDINTQQARNLSTAAVNSKARVRGEMAHVPIPNTDGILVLLGGGQKPVTDLTHEWKGDLVSFQSVDIFDVGSITNNTSSNGTWLSQSTVGTPPAPRLDPCVVMQAAPDNSSYNIYMFGGRDGYQTYYNEMWVLTMPQFRWIQISNAKSNRYQATCHAVGRQMVIVGGSDQSNITAICDPSPLGINVFDMYNMTWSNKFDPSLNKYQVPEVITKFIGGSASGGATANSPASGWTDDRLRAIFSAQGPMTSGKASSKSDSKSSDAGAIAGGVIGGLAGLAIIAGFLFLFLRRRRQKRSAEAIQRQSMIKEHAYSPVNQTPPDAAVEEQDKHFKLISEQQLDSNEVHEMQGENGDKLTPSHPPSNIAEAPSQPPAPPAELP